MKTFSPLVYFGSDDFSALMLARLLEHDFFRSNLKYVVTKTPQKKGRGNVVSPTAVDALASTIPKVTILRANTKKELDAVIESIETPLTGVLVSYGVIVSPFVLNRFVPGIINFHPSLLPQYRGPSPVETAILNGDRTIGVSVMKLAEAMDAGPVYAQKTLQLDGTETPALVYERIVQETGDWFADQLRSILADEPEPQPQDDSQATFTHMFKKQDGYLQPDTQTAQQCERQIRTFLEFPKSRVTINEQGLIVTKSHVVASAKEAPLVLPCANNTFLSIDELIAPSGKTMDASAYLRGLQST